jgi:crotonobetainyl-CoA:carnitine CoA-transferase CaiB-like acyl-CoA transferase
VPCEVESETAGSDLWKNAEALERRWISSHPHRIIKTIGQVGLAFEFSDTPSRIQGGPVLVGENTREILAGVGYSVSEIDALFESGAVNDESVYPALAKAGTEVAKSPWEKN